MILVLCVFYSDNLGEWYEKICKLVGKDKVLLMNIGVEVVEIVLKVVRCWVYDVKGIELNKVEIIVFNGNFYGWIMVLVLLFLEVEY